MGKIVDVSDELRASIEIQERVQSLVFDTKRDWSGI
jgi:hypothetical protein